VRRGVAAVIEALEERQLLSTVATTSPATSVASTTATVNGAVNPSGSTANVSFQYSLYPTFPLTVKTTIATGFRSPSGVAVDAGGDVFVSNTGAGAIDEVAPNGTVSVVTAQLDAPHNLLVQPDGEIYVADAGAGQGGLVDVIGYPVRQSNPIAGENTLLPSPTGVTIDQNGIVFIAANGNTDIDELESEQMFAHIGSGFYDPNDVLADTSGDLFVADTGHNAIKEITTNQQSIITLGSGFSAPQGIALDANDDVFVADTGNGQVKEILHSTGAVVTIASGFTAPLAVALDAAGDIYVADNNGSIYELSPATVTASPASVSGSTATAVSAALSNLTPQRTYYYRVFAQSFSGGAAVSTYSSFTTTAAPLPQPTTGAATATSSTAATINGAVNASGLTANVEFQHSTDSGLTPTIATNIGSGFSNPSGVAVDAAGDVFVANFFGGSVDEVLPSGTIVPIGSGFNLPEGVALDSSGDVFVADTYDGQVKEVQPTGTILTLGSGFAHPLSVAVDSAGDVFVADTGNNAVKKISGGTITTVGSGFSSPGGVAWANNLLYVADTGNNEVKTVNSSNQIGLVNGSFSAPSGVAVDSAGDVFVADKGDNAVNEVLLNGTEKTIGSGFTGPTGVAVDGLGDVFVADYGGNRVVELSLPTVAATPASVSGSTAVAVSGSLTGLTPLTTYYYRVAAEGPGGMAVGAINSFTAPETPSLNVTTTQDVVNAYDGLTSLREAINYANTLTGPQTITFASSLTSGGPATITLGGTELSITASNLTLSGPGANLLSISGNSASRVIEISGGGSISINGLTITGGTVSGGVGGGGIHNITSTLTLNADVLSNNSAAGGGGLSSDVGGTVTITNSTFSNNTASSGGGAIEQQGQVTAAASMTLTNCTISGNTATGGGFGGAISNIGGGGTASLTLQDCTLATNTGATASGIYNFAYSSPANVSYIGTIFANTAGTNVYNSGGTLTSLGHNLSSDSTGNLIATGDLPSRNPLLASLGSYSGPTPTRALLPGSPAINAGVAISGVTTDQRGIARPQGSAADIGAFESQGFTIAITGGNNQSAAINTAMANPLAVKVTAIDTGLSLAGGLITFTAPASGASATFSTNPVTLAADGTASAPATANATTGAYNVTASATGIATPATFSLTNVPTPVTVTSVVVNGNLTGFTGAQRSMVDSIVYTFSEAVTIATTGTDTKPGFAIAVHGTEQGTAPTLNWSTPDGGITWIVTFSGASVIGNSIANGVYDITLNPTAVTSQAHPTATITPRATDTFYRLYGDYNGDQVVNATDNLHFKTAITTYNPIFDYDNNGAVNATDNLHFKASISFVFNAAFTTTI
jgi:sugar lactone lactonase YvrE